MKKRMLVLGLGIVLALSGCGGNKGASDDKKTTEVVEKQTDTTSVSDEEVSKETSENNILDESSSGDEKEQTEENEEQSGSRIDYSQITGEHVLASCEDFVIRMTDCVRIVDSKWEGTIYEIPYECQASERFEGNVTISVDSCLLNGNYVRAMFDEAIITLDDRGTTYYSGTIRLEQEDMVAFEKMMETPAIESLQVGFSARSVTGTELPIYLSGEKIVSDNCPERPVLNSNLVEVYSSNLESIYYGGLAMVDEDGDAYLLFVREAKDVPEYWKTTTAVMLMVDGNLSTVGYHYFDMILEEKQCSGRLLKVSPSEFDVEKNDTIVFYVQETASYGMQNRGEGYLAEMEDVYQPAVFEIDIKDALLEAVK